MKKFKAVTAVIMIVFVLAICSLSAYGAMTTLSCSTYPVWNANETQAYAQTDSYSPATPNYSIFAEIYSNSGEYKYNSDFFATPGSHSVATEWVSVTYGAGLPLVSVNGGYWIP
jgi:flagellar basal body-associated protein FliL